MKIILYGICFVLLSSNLLWAKNLENAEVNLLTKTTASWDGEKLPRYSKGRPEITILRITIPPGSQLPLHKHTVINTGVLIKGELTVITDDNKALHLKAGDPIVEVVNRWHYGKNDGKEPAEIIVFYDGIQNKPITIKK